MQLISFFRNQLFDFKLLPIYKSAKKVVSIGNIVCGGSGKTSFALLLAKSVNLPLAILERGYKAKVRRKEPFVVGSADEGDEAYLLATKNPLATVIISKKRKFGAQMAEKLPVHYIMLDDGMQYRYLHRDIEVVILHYKDIINAPWFQRESPKRLKEAHTIVINGVGTPSQFQSARQYVERFSKAPVIGVAYEAINRDELENKKVAAFCGIGKPNEFYSLLESMGCTIVLRQTLADHAHFERVDHFVERAKKIGAETVVCTEKDYVKIKNTNGITPLIVELKVKFGGEVFEQLCQEIAT